MFLAMRHVLVEFCYYFNFFSVLHMERLDVSNTPDQYSFPNYAEDDLDQLQSYWNAPVDSITLPKNYYDYTSRGNQYSIINT